MTNPKSAKVYPEMMLLIILASAFGILVSTVHKILKQMDLFRGKSSLIMPALVAALAVTGRALLLLLPDGAAEAGPIRNISVNYSLLPAVAGAVAKVVSCSAEEL